MRRRMAPLCSGQGEGAPAQVCSSPGGRARVLRAKAPSWHKGTTQPPGVFLQVSIWSQKGEPCTAGTVSGNQASRTPETRKGRLEQGSLARGTHLFCIMFMITQSNGYTFFPMRFLNMMKVSIRKS